MATSIYDAVYQGNMPPWPPSNNSAEFLHDRSLEANEKTMLMEEMDVKMVVQRRMEMEKQKVNQVMEIQAAMSSMLYDEIFLVSQEKTILYMAKVYFVN